MLNSKILKFPVHYAWANFSILFRKRWNKIQLKPLAAVPLVLLTESIVLSVPPPSLRSNRVWRTIPKLTLFQKLCFKNNNGQVGEIRSNLRERTPLVVGNPSYKWFQPHRDTAFPALRARPI